MLNLLELFPSLNHDIKTHYSSINGNIINIKASTYFYRVGKNVNDSNYITIGLNVDNLYIVVIQLILYHDNSIDITFYNDYKFLGYNIIKNIKNPSSILILNFLTLLFKSSNLNKFLNEIPLFSNFLHSLFKLNQESIYKLIDINPSIFQYVSNIPEIKTKYKSLNKSEEYGLFENNHQEKLNHKFIIAVEDGDLDKVKSLIQQGIDIDNKKDNDWTPLMRASHYGHLNIVKYLVKKGANFKYKNRHNDSILSVAKSNIRYEKGCYDVIEYLKSSDVYIDSTLGIDYDYDNSRKKQIIDAIKKNPSIIKYFPKNELEKIPKISHLLKSDDYGLFENSVYKIIDFKYDINKINKSVNYFTTKNKKIYFDENDIYLKDKDESYKIKFIKALIEHLDYDNLVKLKNDFKDTIESFLIFVKLIINKGLIKEFKYKIRNNPLLIKFLYNYKDNFYGYFNDSAYLFKLPNYPVKSTYLHKPEAYVPDPNLYPYLYENFNQELKDTMSFMDLLDYKLSNYQFIACREIVFDEHNYPYRLDLYYEDNGNSAIFLYFDKNDFCCVLIDYTKLESERIDKYNNKEILQFFITYLDSKFLNIAGSVSHNLLLDMNIFNIFLDLCIKHNLINDIKKQIDKDPSIIEYLGHIEEYLVDTHEHLLKSDEYGLFENSNQEELNFKLIKASKHNDLDQIKILLKNGANIECLNDENRTPLMHACYTRYLNIVKYLVENGANIEAKNNYNSTPLMFAIQNNSFEIVKYLVENGANIYAKNSKNATPISISSKEGYLNILKYLIKNGTYLGNEINIDSALQMAKNFGWSQLIKYLKSDVWIDSVLGSKYNYTKDKKQQIIDAVKINPSIIDKLNKEEIKNIPEIQHLLKGDEYGLFERKIKNYTSWKLN